MPGIRAHPAIVVASRAEEQDGAPILRVADQAIDLWRAAEDLGDPALLDALRPLLTYIARVLAQKVMDADAGETPQ